MRSARPGRSQRNLRRGRVLSSQSSASVSSPLLGANRSAGAPAAKRQRRHSAGAWPHGPSRGAGAEGARAVIGPSARLRGVRGRTGQAALLRPARAGGPGKAFGAHALFPLDQARASARRSRARIVQSGHGRLEMGKCTTIAQTRINTGVFIVVQVYKNRRKRTRIEREAYKNGVYLYTPTTTESRINTGFFLYLYTFGFQVGGCTRTQFPCCCRAGKLPFGGNFGKPLDNRPGRVYNNTSVKQSGAGGSHPCSPV